MMPAKIDEGPLFKLLQITDHGIVGKQLFHNADDAEKWLTWAGLDIIDRFHDVTTERREFTVKNRHGQQFKFAVRRIVEDIERV